ncbi:MAG: hypothetical protein R3A10_19550 [Caldilineaceae bacterium]
MTSWTFWPSIWIGVVPEDSMIVLMTDRGTPAVYDKRCAMARQAYLNIASSASRGNNVPLMDFRPPTWRTRLARIFGPLRRLVAQSPRYRRRWSV